ETAAWDDVAGERLAGQRIADRDRGAVAVARLREVAAPLGLGGDADPRRVGGRRRLRVVLLRQEEEQLALALRAHERHRPAEVPAVIVVAVVGARPRGGV